ncbi:MAG: thermonuclease family protein [Candidatus Omnitrophota bacterium]|nr:thermonuclease family protein [Candidatus Omnitrophota bacterium]
MRNRKIFLLLAFLGVSSISCGSRAPLETAKITKVMGRYVEINGSRPAAMVGVYVPFPQEKNFMIDSWQNMERLLKDQEVQIRLVEKKHKVGYPEFDLVEIYREDVNLNKRLLETGLALFNEDHWDSKEKAEYKALAEEARRQRLGIWAYQESLAIVYRRPSNGRFVHFPHCPHVKDLPESEREDYYAPIPDTPFLAIRYAYFCDFCRSIWNEQLEKKDPKKVKLGS